MATGQAPGRTLADILRAVSAANQAQWIAQGHQPMNSLGKQAQVRKDAVVYDPATGRPFSLMPFVPQPAVQEAADLASLPLELP